jgi:hypothetical protein
MSFIRYEEAPVMYSFAAGTEPDQTLLATNVTVSENMPLTPVRALGYNGAIAVMPSGPPEGSFSVTYNIQDPNVKREPCDGATATEPRSENADWYDASRETFVLKRGYVSDENIVLSVGNPNNPLFKQGFATSYSLTAEPNAVITASVNGSFFDCGIIAAAKSITAHPNAGADANQVGGGELSLLHGGNAHTKATSTGLGFNCNPFTANYEASRGTNPIYNLGSLQARFVQVTDPQESITLQGENLPAGTMGSDCDPCTIMTNISFTVASLCGSSALATYAVCGPVQSRDIEVAVDDILRGNITVVDYTLRQQLPDLSGISC